MDALTTCNAAPMADNPAGYCAGCMAEAGKASHPQTPEACPECSDEAGMATYHGVEGI